MTFQVLRTLQAAAGKSPSRVSRRRALQSALAAAGGLLSLEPSRAWAQNAKRRVIVVGAGLAGLSCADELAAAGCHVTVVEARGRVGGRVETLSDLVPGKLVEAGGELVGPNQPRWMAYAKRFDLKFVELPWNPSDVVVLDGQRLEPARAKSLWNEMRDALVRLNELAKPLDANRPWTAVDAATLDRRSLAEWIGSLDLSQACRQLIEIQFTAINGLIPGWQSLLGILSIVRGGGLQKFWDETDTLHCVGGTQQLAKLLAQSFTQRSGVDQLRLNTPVQAIEVNERGARVRLADGTWLVADDVVLTAPASTYGRIAFSPTLPGSLQVLMAASTKYLAVVREAVWQKLGVEPNAMSNGPVQVTWETTAGQGAEGHHALVAFGGGREADDARHWPAVERESRYRRELDALFPGFAAAMSGGRFIDWVTDPWARGTYSFPAPGHVTTVGPQLATPHHGRLHFAGEHCCYAFTGWMEGALQSGGDVARRIVERAG